MSSFTWLDSSEQQRTQMLDVINLFREKETRDELGIGTVRDAFADLFFPGTSTIQSRARYFLFIPWIYTFLESKRVPSAKIWPRARWEEVNLINALIRNKAGEGIIGVQARGALKRLPSAIYWQGLGAWGIRLFPGSVGSYHHTLDSFYATNSHTHNFHWENKSQYEINEMQLRQVYNWHPGVRDLRPANFPEEATFVLSLEEATYLQERILSSQPGSLLAFFVTEPTLIPRTDFPWDHPAGNRLPAYLQEQLSHARHFSLVIYGATLLYNLMLAEKVSENSSGSALDLVEAYQEAIADWAQKIRQEADRLGEWDWQNRFWEIVHTVNPRIPLRTVGFINDWLLLALNDQPELLPQNRAARQLVQQRERRLKGKLSRLVNPRALELWNGQSGLGMLNYRWGVTQNMLSDIAEGVSRA